LTDEPELSESADYQALVAGEIGPDEYARRLRDAVRAEEQSSVRDADRAERIGELVRGPSVFLSHSHDDKALARVLAVELEKRGAAVWIDEGELRVGDSIIESISKAITEVQYIVVLVSESSVGSPWVAKELSLATTRVLARQGVKVLPVRIGDVNMPPALSDLLYLQLNTSEVPAAAEKIYRDLLSHEAELTAARQSVSSPTGTTSASWILSGNELIQEALNEVRRGDSIALSARLNELPRAAAEAARDRSSLGELLDRLGSLIAAFASHEVDDWAMRYAKGFERIYNDTFDRYGASRADAEQILPEQIWLDVIVRLEAVGALAVRLEKWALVRQLALTPVTAERPPFYSFALRHGLTMAARARLFEIQDGDRTVQLSLLLLARECIEHLDALTVDLPSEDVVLTSLCQFDTFAAFAAIAAGGAPDSRYYYTNFARFNTWRSEPAIRLLIEDASTRSLLFPRSDHALALAIRVVDRLAGSEAFRFNGWDAIQDPVILNFLQLNPQDEDQIRNTIW
jgi:TIR domain